MCKSTTHGIGYRSLQAVSDLRAVARSASPQVAVRIAAGTDGAATPEDFHRLIGPGGCRLSQPADLAMHRGLVLAATLPEDPGGFRIATAILLADRLQHGLGEDDLFWHWDAFQERYFRFGPAERAAILQGFARAHAEALVNLYDPPSGAATATLSAEDVQSAISSLSADAEASSLAAPIRRVLDRQAPTGEAAVLWADHRAEIAALPAKPAQHILAALRYLYETRLDYDPFRGTLLDPFATDLPVLPFDS